MEVVHRREMYEHTRTSRSSPRIEKAGIPERLEERTGKNTHKIIQEKFPKRKGHTETAYQVPSKVSKNRPLGRHIIVKFQEKKVDPKGIQRRERKIGHLQRIRNQSDFGLLCRQ